MAKLVIAGEQRNASDGGTTEIRNPATGEVVDRVISAGDEDGLAIWDQPRADHVHHAADALQGDVGINRRVIVDVGAGLHVDRVAVLRGIDGRSNGGKLLSRANGQDAPTR